MSDSSVDGSERWRVVGLPADSMSPVVREVKAESAEEAKEKYLRKIGHKNVRNLRAQLLNTDTQHGDVNE